jgi:hypothetical protein
MRSVPRLSYIRQIVPEKAKCRPCKLRQNGSKEIGKGKDVMKKWSRSRTQMVAMVASVMAARALSASEPWEQSIGTWRELPDQASAIRMKIEDASPNLRISECDKDGKCIHELVFQYGEKKYKGPDEWGKDFSFRRTGPYTVEETDWKTGTDILLETDVYTFAKDGKTMTQRMVFEPSEHAKTRPLPVTRYYNRFGDTPPSADNPFVGYWIEDHSKVSPRDQHTIKRTGDLTVDFITTTGESWPIIFDGKDHPLKDHPECEIINAQFIDSETNVSKCMTAGKVVWIATDKYSDGGTRVSTSFVNDKGVVFQTSTYEKVK